ncbi:DUF5677 domain-containing protein [Dialister invisus]|mgnify:FL=1|jgi:hypothetical protein|uniref:DUF5677 domain-containing protein n=1 Tax=Dialister invisus TaxID=218538 RepID=UPI00399410A9
MRNSKLSEHTFVKGRFITPLNSLPMMQELEDEKSWTYGRMPEYIWIGLILKYFGREEGLKKSYYIISKIHNVAPDLYTVRLSQILKLDTNIQEEIYEYIISLGVKDAISPLTIFLTGSQAPVFAKYFYSYKQGIEDRCKAIVETMSEIMDHQSNEATDIRFVAVYFNILSGKMHLLKEQVNLLISYPASKHIDEIMRMARPIVRSLEMMILTFENTDSEYLKGFWRCVSEMTECDIFVINFPEENRSITAYMESLHEVFVYLSELLIASNMLDEKMNVLLGIATYSYKRLKEIYRHQLFNSISGRSCVRVLIEDYIMMKYLMKNEAFHENIWHDYQLYGMGLYKLVLARHRESDCLEESHFDEKYIEALVNEFKGEEFINMDTRYFDKQNIRSKAESVNEKSLFGLYYDYDSSFEHGLWGAIRESSLLKCNNPAHKYHCVPDIEDEIVLKTVLPDCVMIMNKTILFLNELYGIPEQLLNEVINYELKPIIK